MKRVIVVLGMHRSGTSAITRGLQELGADLGPDLMPAAEGDNDKGFWEDMGAYRINERILSKLGSSWDGLAEISTEALMSDQLAQGTEPGRPLSHHGSKSTQRCRLPFPA